LHAFHINAPTPYRSQTCLLISPAAKLLNLCFPPVAHHSRYLFSLEHNAPDSQRRFTTTFYTATTNSKLLPRLLPTTVYDSAQLCGHTSLATRRGQLATRLITPPLPHAVPQYSTTSTRGPVHRVLPPEYSRLYPSDHTVRPHAAQHCRSARYHPPTLISIVNFA